MIFFILLAIMYKYVCALVRLHGTHRDALKAFSVLEAPLPQKGVELAPLVISARRKVMQSRALKVSTALVWGIPNRWNAIQVIVTRLNHASLRYLHGLQCGMKSSLVVPLLPRDLQPPCGPIELHVMSIWPHLSWLGSPYS